MITIRLMIILFCYKCVYFIEIKFRRKKKTMSD